MSLGTTIIHYRDAAGGNKQVAPLLHERWPHAAARPSITTLNSRLSDLVGERSRGVKFFFDDIAIASLLFEVLAVPHAERDELRAVASDLAAGDPPARLIVEVSALPVDDREGVDRLFEQVESQIPTDLQPVIIVLRESQYRWLPRSIEPPRYRIERVADEGAGREVASELASRRGLFWSPNHAGVPPERWVALHLAAGKLHTYPENALETFARQGSLPVPPVPARSLQSLGVAATAVRLPTDPREIRKLYDVLVDPVTCATVGEPARRVGLAEALAIAAAATERECVEHDLGVAATRLGLVPATASGKELRDLLDRATRREVPPTLLRVGDRLHAVNVVGAEAGGNVEVHRVAPRPALLTRLFAAVAPRTVDDWRDDRFLEHGFEPEEGEAEALRSARATLLHTGVTPAAVAPDADALLGLRLLLDGPAPAAQLAVEHQRSPAGLRIVLTRAEYERLARGSAAGTEGYWRVPAGIDECLISRSDQLCDISSSRVEAAPNHPLVALGTEYLSRPNEWLDLMDQEQAALAWSRGSYVGGMRVPTLSHREPKPARRSFIQAHPGRVLGKEAWETSGARDVPIPATTWREADLNLALFWHVMRRALGEPLAIPVHDGTLLLDLGHGVFASIHARRHGPPDREVGAWLSCLCTVGGGLGPLLAPAATHIGAGGAPMGPAMPHGVLIRGLGWVVEVTFVGCAVLAGTLPRAAARFDGFAGA